MQKVLGLDIGNYSIKAVEMIYRFKSYEISRFYEIPVPTIESVPMEVIGATALQQLFTDHEISVDKIFTSILGIYASSRILQLANVKKKNLDLILQNELEEQSLFPIEESVFDYQVLGVKDGISSILTVLCKKENVQQYIETLHSLHVEPKIIDVDYLSYMNFISYLPSEPTLLIDIGHVKTSLLFFSEGHLISSRILMMGGMTLTQYLSKDLQVTFAEAQRIKHMAMASDTLDISEELQKKITDSSLELMKEISRTVQAFKANEKINLNHLLVVGGQGDPLKHVISEALEIPLLPFELSSTEISYSNGNPPPYMAQAMALAFRGIPQKNSSRINLRKGELSFTGSYDALSSSILNIGFLCLGVFFCFAASYMLRWSLYSSRIQTIKKDYRQEVLKLLDNAEPKDLKSISSTSNWNLDVYGEKASRYLNEVIKNQKSVLYTFTQKRQAVSLYVLNEISKAIPKEVVIDVTQFTTSGQNVTIEAEAASFAVTDKVIELLKKGGLFQTIEKKSQENKPGSDGKIIKFVLAGQLKEEV
jgi:type IV pilus assembly protein PilM